MVIRSNGYFTLDGANEGVLTIIGTDDQVFANLLAQAPSGRCFVSGVLINETPQDYNIKIVGMDQEASIFRIRGFESIKFTKMPMSQLRVAVNGTIRLRGLGLITDPINDVDGHDRSMLNITSGLFLEPDVGRILIYNQKTHTDINTATTTTVLDPTAGRTGRLSKATISAQGACRLTLETTDADGSSNINILGIINFAGEGTFIYDFGDKGETITNGVNGLVRLISNNTAVVDIDLISRAD